MPMSIVQFVRQPCRVCRPPIPELPDNFAYDEPESEYFPPEDQREPQSSDPSPDPPPPHSGGPGGNGGGVAFAMFVVLIIAIAVWYVIAHR